jgi:predicted metal-binding membrane protein
MVETRNQEGASGEVLIWGLVAGAWGLALLLVTLGHGDLLMNHDALIEGHAMPFPLALLVFFAAWQVMIIGMMLPTSAPMFGLFARASRQQARPGMARAAFLAAYFAVWTAFAAVALANDAGLHWLVDHWGWLDERQWLIGGTVLVLAGAFQFSPLKDHCLDACRNPMSFLWHHYGQGMRAAWSLGIQHGLFCVGCCWALMLLMFAVGVGSVSWMAWLTAVMIVEKTMPWGRRLVPGVGVTLLVWGVLVLLQPGWLPGMLGGTG